MAEVVGRGQVENGGYLKFVWETMGDDDKGRGMISAMFNDKSVMVIGTYNSATVTIEGSNDGGTTWITLEEPDGTALSFTVNNQLKQILQNPELIRPQTIGGSSTDIDVYLIGRSNA